MKKRTIPILLVLLASTAMAGEKPAEKDEQQAKICDPAVKLKGLQWIKGGPVELKKDNIYVVEFWATWCPPCRVTIPHLTKLQKKFKDKKVTFVGISNESPDKVKPFVKDKGETMDYIVAIDPQRKISDGYMKAYKQQGIPTAFIVDKQLRVVWVGHPMSDLEAVLEKVVAGTFDARAYAAKKELERKKEVKAIAALREYFEVIKTDDPNKATTSVNTIIENGSSTLINAFAWRILTEVEQTKQDLPIALKAATKANTMTEGKNAAILDTFALALFKNGKVEQAIEAQTEALKLAAGNEEMEKEFRSRLDEFTRAAKQQ
jgi:thiol-disulfide isomerase/thioredoxin